MEKCLNSKKGSYIRVWGELTRHQYLPRVLKCHKSCETYDETKNVWDKSYKTLWDKSCKKATMDTTDASRERPSWVDATDARRGRPSWVNGVFMTDVPRAGGIAMTNDLALTYANHRKPLEASWDEYARVGTVYVSYWRMRNNGSPYENVSGAGRLFWPACVGYECGRPFETLPAIVGVWRGRHSAGTPVLGWCACVCCLSCVTRMPRNEDGMRKCPSCYSQNAHQCDYLMYPLTEEGREYNVRLEREYSIKEREKRRKIMEEWEERYVKTQGVR
jgi:hypothetical protein